MTRRSFLLITILLGGLMLTAVCGRPALAAQDKKQVLVLTEGIDPITSETLGGIRDVLSEPGQNVNLVVRFIDPEGSAARIIDPTEPAFPQPAGGWDAIIALGSHALHLACRQYPERPVVGGLIMNSDEHLSLPNVTPVVLDFSAATQLGWIKRLLPSARSVGVLYDPQYNEPSVAELRKAAADHSLELVEKSINHPREIPAALKSLPNRIDVLLGIADPTVLTPATAKALLLFSIRNRIPFVGPSRAWVKGGALLALERDYRAIGRQCGNQALSLLHQPKRMKLPATGPDRVLPALNQKAAEKLNVNLPEPLRKEITYLD